MGHVERRVRAGGVVSWRVNWRDNHTQRRESRTFARERDARMFNDLLVANEHRLPDALSVASRVVEHGPTVIEAVLEHISLLTAASPRTLTDYRRQAELYIAPTLGPIPVSGLHWRIVAQWVQGLKELPMAGGRPMTAKTIANLHGLLSASMTTAVRLGYRSDNPCRGVELPKSTATEDDMCLLSHAEVGLILQHLDERYRPLVLLLVSTGLRWGEATALTVGDLELDDEPATVRVTKAWKRDAAQDFYVGPPKTPKARRTVSLPAGLVPVLRTHVADKARDDLVFVNSVGRFLRSSTFWDNYWSPAIAAAMNPADPVAPRLSKRPRIHDLRHTHASWLIREGEDMFVVQRRLGHESITTTTDRYSHLMPEQLRTSAAAADRAIAGLIRS